MSILETIGRDLRFAVRMLSKSPGFTATAVLTLGLCIGANTAIFSVVDAVLLRPLPYPQPDRLAQVATVFRANGTESTEISQDGRTWETVRDHATSIDAAAYSDWPTGVNFAAQNKAEYLMQQRVGAGFFRVLGVPPMIGREFTPDEDRPGGARRTLLSCALWKRVFHGDRSVIGRDVTLRGEPYTVVGVMPAGFQTSAPADLWTPLRPSTTDEGAGENYGIVARLNRGVNWAQAESQIISLGAGLIPGLRLPREVSARFGLIPLQQGLTQDLRRPLLILWGAVGLVLFIGCVNIASLLLARSSGRTREIATRMALGSGRLAVVRQLLAESLLLSVAGGAVGIAFGSLGLKGLKLLAPESLDVWQTVGLDVRVLAAAAALTLITSVLFGLAPALHASRVDLQAAFTEGGRRNVAGGANRWPRRLLVVGEVALGVVLLIAAGLLIRTFAHLQNLSPGFDPHDVITAKLSLQDARYTTSQSVNRLFDASLARIRELPGVEWAAVVLGLPYERLLNMGFRRLDGPPQPGERLITSLCYVTPQYFQALRIPQLRGRAFFAADQPDSRPVMIVNDAFVRTYLRNQEPVGSHIRIADVAREIVGVAGAVQQKPGWGDNGPLALMPVAYIPVTQTSDEFLKLVHTWFSPNWVVRTRGPVEGAIAGIQRSVEAVDPQLPFAGFRNMGEVRSATLAPQRFLTTLLGVLAGLALLLAAIGIYGLIANSVVESTHELGIRMALGATVWQAMTTVALPGIALSLAGVMVGCALSAAAAQVLRHVVWGVSPTDPLTFAGVGLVLLLVAALATAIPAGRILRLDPAHTLRHE